ncbi:AmmeMemoRadiSam system protein A [Desulfolucanica intricata]|uniref:AmmeMemoRadiSam system protein A n=1 Tax=Desulfolucanica intricata TaxID=1285191 RepID=UPI0008303F74|nr:AmmeMemoRadiSam system protein A [Desulfolucanica intricata]
MSLVFCGVCPHPPIVVPEVGGEEAAPVKRTQEAMLEIGRRIKKCGAEVLVMISPHSPVFRDAVAINFDERLKGNLGQFRAPQVSFELKNELGLAAEIKKEAGNNGIMTADINKDLISQYQISTELDHGLMVPLYFLQKEGVNIPLVAISMSLLPVKLLYTFGAGIGRAVRNYGKRVALIASGDLSHCLTSDAPAGYEPRGEEFDREIVRLVGKAEVESIMKLDRELIERAGECGFRPIVMMFGALDGYQVDADVLSYEGPFGVGYMVASLIPGKPDREREFLNKFTAEREAELTKRRRSESYLVQLARKTLEDKVRGKTVQTEFEEIPPEFQKKAGVFVSIKKHGQLRGCIGTVFPRKKNIPAEVVQNALSAGLEDPRFYPVQEEELPDLIYSVDVLTEPEKISSMDELNPAKYGVIVRSGHRTGLLLPDLEGIDTPEEQVEIAKQKAGIGPGEPVELERFKVIRYT